MIDLSRRVLMGAGVCVVALTPFAAAAPAQAAAATAAASRYRRSRFTPLRRASFGVTGGGHRWSMRLVEVGDLSARARGADDCFSLTFRCPTGGPPQGSYTFSRSGFAATSLFIVPVDASRRTYQAIISRAE